MSTTVPELLGEIAAIVISDYAILPGCNPAVEEPEYVATGVLADGRPLTIKYVPSGEPSLFLPGSRLEIALVPAEEGQEGFRASGDLQGVLGSFSFLSFSGLSVEFPGYLQPGPVAHALREKYEWLLGFAHSVLTDRAFRHEAAYRAANAEQTA